MSRSISGKRYNRYFGFSEQEVSRMLSDAGLSEHLPEMKRWYDGYRFGGEEVYCPWDVINHVNDLLVDENTRPENYWRNTSHNSIIRKFIDISGPSVNEKFETLLSDGVIREQVAENLTYDIAHSTEDNLWSILYLTGYLTQSAVDFSSAQASDGKMTLRIPNEEITTIFADTVAKWFRDSVEAVDRREFFAACLLKHFFALMQTLPSGNEKYCISLLFLL